MAVRSISDVICVLIARLPFLLIVAGAVWALVAGISALEHISFGSEYFVGNHETTNLPAGTGPSNEQILMDALNTGDPEAMNAAMERVEQRTEALATR